VVFKYERVCEIATAGHAFNDFSSTIDLFSEKMSSDNLDTNGLTFLEKQQKANPYRKNSDSGRSY
jgi:hypothetical protein